LAKSKKGEVTSILPNFCADLRKLEAKQVIWEKIREDAVEPFKKHESDSGYDLTLLDLKQVNDRIEVYGTGIKIKPSPGYYFNLVARSSLFKSGRMLANSIGIIDESYRGEILVVMYNFSNTDKERFYFPLDLPGRYVQIIPRARTYVDFIEGMVDDTARSEGGFGSTGLNKL